jgi:hypothetical protein
VTARVGSLALSNYSVKYWHIALSDCLSILNNMTVSSTVTIPARPLRPEKCRNELKVLLQRQDLAKIRPQNELSFCAKRTGRRRKPIGWDRPALSGNRPLTRRAPAAESPAALHSPRANRYPWFLAPRKGRLVHMRPRCPASDVGHDQPQGRERYRGRGGVCLDGHGMVASSTVQHHPGARSATPPRLRRGVHWLPACWVWIWGMGWLPHRPFSTTPALGAPPLLV